MDVAWNQRVNRTEPKYGSMEITVQALGVASQHWDIIHMTEAQTGQRPRFLGLLCKREPRQFQFDGVTMTQLSRHILVILRALEQRRAAASCPWYPIRPNALQADRPLSGLWQ